MAELFEKFMRIIPDWGNEPLKKDLVEAVDVFEQQQKKKTRFAL